LRLVHCTGSFASRGGQMASSWRLAHFDRFLLIASFHSNCGNFVDWCASKINHGLNDA
jgi:hypothetical protein